MIRILPAGADLDRHFIADQIKEHGGGAPPPGAPGTPDTRPAIGRQ